jgi:hypothetical protein
MQHKKASLISFIKLKHFQMGSNHHPTTTLLLHFPSPLMSRLHGINAQRSHISDRPVIVLRVHRLGRLKCQPHPLSHHLIQTLNRRHGLLLHVLVDHAARQPEHHARPDLFGLHDGRVGAIALHREPIDRAHLPAAEPHHVVVENGTQRLADVLLREDVVVEAAAAQIPVGAHLVRHDVLGAAGVEVVVAAVPQLFLDGLFALVEQLAVADRVVGLVKHAGHYRHDVQTREEQAAAVDAEKMKI